MYTSSNNITLNITKVDENCKSINCVSIFGIYKNNHLVKEFTTDTYGKATIDVPKGNYTLKEEFIENKYTKDSIVYKITPTTNHVISTSHLKVGRVVIIIKNINNIPYKGYIIIKNKEQETVKEIRLDNQSKKSLKLPLGEYVVHLVSVGNNEVIKEVSVKEHNELIYCELVCNFTKRNGEVVKGLEKSGNKIQQKEMQNTIKTYSCSTLFTKINNKVFHARNTKRKNFRRNTK